MNTIKKLSLCTTTLLTFFNFAHLTETYAQDVSITPNKQIRNSYFTPERMAASHAPILRIPSEEDIKKFFEYLYKGDVMNTEKSLSLMPILAQTYYLDCPPVIIVLRGNNSHNSLKILKLLHQYGADFNGSKKTNSPASFFEHTPLSYAIALGKTGEHFIDYLLSYGADARHPSVILTAVEMSCKYQHHYKILTRASL